MTPPRHRLNRQAVAAPLTEAQFQRQVVELAELCGWETFHVRAGRTADSWRVPGSGTMAKGWPDLCLVHPTRRLLLFIEVKTDTGKLTAHQERVLDMLGRLDEIAVEVHVWRPSDWPFIQETLSERRAA